MKKCLVFLSHDPTAEQVSEIKEKHGVSELIRLPPTLQTQWSNVDPSLENLDDTVQTFIDWIESFTDDELMLWLQGDYGLCYQIVKQMQGRGISCVYATTNRSVISIEQADGSHKIVRSFKHVRFREF